jgi:hypothetical protein
MWIPFLYFCSLVGLLSKQIFGPDEEHLENHTFFVIKHYAYVWVAVHSISKIARDFSTVSVEKWDMMTSYADPDPFDSDPTMLVCLIWIRIRLL